MAFPTPEEELAQSIPIDVVYQAPPPVPLDFILTDRVEIRRKSPGEPREIAIGNVKAIVAGSITLGTKVYAVADGWEYSLITRKLVMPETISEIEATLDTGQVVQLMGRNAKWVTEDGQVVRVINIVSFVLL